MKFMNTNIMTNILLCENDENQGMLLRECLQMKGYHARLCMDGLEALDVFRNGCYDLCVFSVSMPRMDGLQLAHEIRQMNADVPIVMLADRKDCRRVVEGFDMGCDDFLTKPILMEELLSRLVAIMKRVHGKKNVELTHFPLGESLFNNEKRTITSGTLVKRLTTRENELLSLLCMRANNVLSRDLTLRNIWGYDNSYNARSMDVYINKLRKILKETNSGAVILNIHGKGYKLVLPSKKIDCNSEKATFF